MLSVNLVKRTFQPTHLCGGTDHHIHKHTLFYLRAHYKSPELKSFIRHHAHPYIISFLCPAHARGFPIYWPAGMRDLSVMSHALKSHSCHTSELNLGVGRGLIASSG